ncbi:DNA-directed RNA polymerase specialized sigma24 family protein [Thermocatellispora tengchongensis]|uniref:DNA-directed RNA polymerase specialized sigma24 family protein n=1 Tax=Thermocatellispora tengchongensis TaxID=1073253 RepID=A0A840PBX3_9ACTN|nr:DUF742 domain-containing protein [Thermocatellispora tengchongensis]MBB5136489.1 DNA-directed RNA polymerase specialized sigma24 family protein [Thermocatellispora tengchongensis]
MSGVQEPGRGDREKPRRPEPVEEQWLDEHAGPVVRPYVMTRGRTEPVRGDFNLISLVVAQRAVPAAEAGLDPEHRTIMRLCREPQSVAEIAAYLDLPAGTVRVLLGDLLDRGYIAVQDPQPEMDIRDRRMYEAVLNGLRAL